MTAENIKVEILRHPQKEDWERCKMLALNTVGKKYMGSEIDEKWKKQILNAGHSPIRTLMFTIRMEIPYYVSTHFVRHKVGVEHYVQSQRNDRQSKYDRELAPQSAMVSHIMDINAEQLMFMSHRRLCGQADETTRYVMTLICLKVIKINPEFNGFLVPMCEHLGRCPEFKSCNHWKEVQKNKSQKIIEINPDFGFYIDANDGYCPCAIERTEDTLCMCKEFREQEEGVCHCGRYKKVKVKS